MYQPKTGEKCGCKRGIQRDNCPNCEDTGWVVDFKTIHELRNITVPGTMAQSIIEQITNKESLFNKCVEVHHIGQRAEIRCRLGLWSVEASNLDAAEREARHYWIQYWQDGEYDALLSDTESS